MPKLDFLSNVLLTMFYLLLDTLRFIRVSLRPRCALAAENLFLRKQLALYLERRVKPRRAEAALCPEFCGKVSSAFSPAMP